MFDIAFLKELAKIILVVVGLIFALIALAHFVHPVPVIAGICIGLVLIWKKHRG